MGIKIYLNRFPGGKRKAQVMSYDDGVRQDLRLIEIFNRHGIKGTFHINAGMFGSDASARRLSREEIAAAYAGAEISAHGYMHRAMSVLPGEETAEEVMLDRAALEELTSAPVRGMSYAYGSVSDAAVNILRALGVEYCRLTKTTGGFDLPADPLRWEPTCHHNGGIIELAEKFIADKNKLYPRLLYVWGHSYEFDNDDNWQLIERFCALTGSAAGEIWFAKNIELSDYMKAVRALRFTVDRRAVYNPSAINVWLEADGECAEIPAGQTVRLG